MDELVKALRNHRVCDEDKCATCELMDDAADAIEKLMAEVEQWKTAWKTAYKCYESAQREIDEMRGIESTDQKGDEPECPSGTERT